MTHRISRRAALAGLPGLSAAAATKPAAAAPDDVAISFCARLYDRMLPLYTGAVRIPGVQLNFLPNADHREVFDRMEHRQEFDASELSFSDYITLVSRDRHIPLVALPVFPSRVFRHGFIFVNQRAGIKQPKDLEGKRVGIPRWGETAVIWIRGMLQDEYGIDLTKIYWVTGNVNRGGLHGAPPPMTPSGFNIEANGSGKSLNQALEMGEVDATMTAELPDALGRNPDIVRLFPNFRELEKDWYRRTRLYPIMHVIAMRRDTHERHPWLAANLAQGLQASKLQALADMQYTASLLYMQPWLQSDNEEWRSVLGADPFPYGLEANRPSVEAMMRYMAAQGMIDKAMPAEDIFVPVSL